MNAVVSRRLAFVPDSAARAALADRFAAGEPIARLADEAGLSVTRAAYCLRADLVERDAVPESVYASANPGDAWVACILRVTPQSLKRDRDRRAALAG